MFLFVNENIERSPRDMKKLINMDLKLGVNLRKRDKVIRNIKTLDALKIIS
jgi:hypothetical protein